VVPCSFPQRQLERTTRERKTGEEGIERFLHLGTDTPMRWLIAEEGGIKKQKKKPALVPSDKVLSFRKKKVVQSTQGGGSEG